MKQSSTVKPCKRGRPKSESKKLSILSAASESFLESGYKGTSLDSVAIRAAVSKQTVYSHFVSKEDLFSACIRKKCTQYSFDLNKHSLEGSSFQDTLQRISYEYLELIHDPDVIRLYRLVLSESGTDSKTSQTFFQLGIQKYQSSVSQFFEAQTELMEVSRNAHYYTELFFSLIQGQYLTRNLLGVGYRPSTAEKIAVSKSRVNSFMLLAKSGISSFNPE